MEIIQNILLGGEAETGLLLFSLQASVLKPTCQEEKMNRFPPAYGISTGAPIKQLAGAALCTYRKQLILIASCRGASNLDPVSDAKRILPPFLTRFFSPSFSCDTWKPVAACPWQLAQPAHSAVKTRGPSHLVSDHLTWPLYSTELASDVRSNIFVDNTSFLCLKLLANRQSLLRCTDKTVCNFSGHVFIEFWESGKSAPHECSFRGSHMKADDDVKLTFHFKGLSSFLVPVSDAVRALSHFSHMC